MRGSILGLGTDIAGSVRVPALCSGTYAFMPTANRVPYGRLQEARRSGIPGIESVAGSLATTVRDIDLFFKSVLLDDIWAVDETALHLPWRKDTNVTPSKPLRIGVILESDHQPIHPPILRSLTSAQTVLSKAGHTLVPLPDAGSLIHPSAITAWKLLFLDPNPIPLQTVQRGREPLITSLTNGLQDLAELAGYKPTLEGLFDLNVQRSKMQATFRQIFTDNDLDVILLPGNQTVAPPHDTYGIPEYTVLANLLNVSLPNINPKIAAQFFQQPPPQFPAAIIPYLHAHKKTDQVFQRDVQYKIPCKLVHGV